ncbi:MAG: acyl-CoA thioesterase [Legionella sp.]
MLKPRGEIIIQTVTMPADTNANGDIFGGWLLSQMDLAAGVVAKRLSRGRVATVAIESMTFLKPVHVGDLISCYVELIKIGHTSLTLAVEVWTKNIATGEHYPVTSGNFVFVAIDEQRKPRQVPK